MGGELRVSNRTTTVAGHLEQDITATLEPFSDAGPVDIPRGKIVGGRWRILKKLGEGGCGAVYRVEDMNAKPPLLAALKAESNFVSGGSVLKLEVQVLRRLAGHPHVAQLLHSGKKEHYCYMVMTLLGESLHDLLKKYGKMSTISTQVRTGLNVLFGIKQIHDVGFVHRDLKPANIAIGRKGTAQEHFLHILDFGLAREFVIIEDGKAKMRRPRAKALFRGTTRYCSISTHERIEQGRVDDLWSLLYVMAEMRDTLPWSSSREKKDVLDQKKHTAHDILLGNSPVELLQFAQHLSSLTYYSRPDYTLLYNLLNQVIEAGQFKFSDPWDWENASRHSMERVEQPSSQNLSKDRMSKEQISRQKQVSKECDHVLRTDQSACPQTDRDHPR